MILKSTGVITFDKLFKFSIDSSEARQPPNQLIQLSGAGGGRSLFDSQIWIWETTRVGRSKLGACTAAGVLDSVELRAVVDPRGRQSCLCDYPAY